MTGRIAVVCVLLRLAETAIGTRAKPGQSVRTVEWKTHMVDTSHEDPARPSSRQVARLLLESARQDPALLGRAHRRMDDGLAGRTFPLSMETAFHQPIRLLGAAPYGLGQPRDDLELENLVSIAVESVHQAEDAVQKARQATGTMRRGLVLCAGLGVVGILAAMAAIVDNHLYGAIGVTMAPPKVASATAVSAEPARSAANSPVRAPSPTQTTKPDAAAALSAAASWAGGGQAPGAPPAMRTKQDGQTTQAGGGTAVPVEPSHMGANQKAEAESLTPTMQTGSAAGEAAVSPPQGTPASGLLIATAAAQPTVRPIVPPVYHGSPATYSASRSNRHPVRYYAGAPPAPRVMVPPFFDALRRDVSALFRNFPPHS